MLTVDSQADIKQLTYHGMAIQWVSIINDKHIKMLKSMQQTHAHNGRFPGKPCSATFPLIFGLQ